MQVSFDQVGAYKMDARTIARGVNTVMKKSITIGGG
jgi:hypothetical protein